MLRDCRILLLLICCCLLCSPVLHGGDVPYDHSPNWMSTDKDEWAQSMALADLDNDGWPDQVVSNDGGHLIVHYNQGDGTFHGTPDWLSSGADDHMGLAVGDIDGDGWFDVAVSVATGDGWSEDGTVQLYLNNGFGQLELTPSWTPAEDVHSTGCAFGDLDNDGDLDLAVACGRAVIRGRTNRVFRNVGGILETTPIWESAELDVSTYVSWADVDRDGDLDLAFGTFRGPSRVYYNNDGVMSAIAGWSSEDTDLQAVNSLAWGDVSGDGWPDLAVADMDSISGSSRFKVYLNDGSGMLGTTPAWSSTESGNGSSVAWCDADNDGDLDLFSGQSLGPVLVHENKGGTLSSPPIYRSYTGSYVEHICFADTDRDQVRQNTYQFTSIPGRTLYDLPHRPIERILSLTVGSMPCTAFCASLEHGWVSLPADPAGDPVEVVYERSRDLEMMVANLDGWAQGNFLFVNNGVPVEDGLILTGPGPGPDNPPEVRCFAPGGGMLLSLDAYGVEKYGVNVAAGRIDAEEGAEIITGPGPGEVFGPQVRAFTTTGAAVPGASFFAYGTNKFGVNVSAGDLDGDGDDEIVTGAGPGTVFGPHVRAFSYESDTMTPVPGVSYFAYGTLKYGVNVACGDLDGDGMDEIVTGAGPGAVFGPHVRGWNVDGGTAGPLGGVSYFAYSTLKWGVNVACGDLDGDGMDEIITGAGPGVVFGPHVRGWNIDGGVAEPISGINYFAFATTEYGVEVGTGDLDGDGIDEILTTPGPGPPFAARVRGWNYDGDELTALESVDFLAYPSAEVGYGAKVAFLKE